MGCTALAQTALAQASTFMLETNCMYACLRSSHACTNQTNNNMPFVQDHPLSASLNSINDTSMY